jgi:hypothetical protein
MPKVILMLQRGLLADRPAAGDVIPGTLYYATDTSATSQSRGGVWVTYADSGGGGGGNVNAASTLTANAVVIGLGSTDVEVLASLGNAGDVLTSAGAGSPPAFSPIAAGGRLLGKQTFQSPGAGTYTPTAGTNFIILELQGAGGGGSGVASAGVNQVNLGGSGGGGGWLRKLLTANFSGAGYVVGAKGTGGASGNNNGTNGTATTFTDTAATVYTASGGALGTPKTSFAPPITHFGGAGGGTTNGDEGVPGQGNTNGIAPNQFVGWGAPGGASQYSHGADPVGVANSTSTAGNNATGYGGGGGAAVSSNAGGAKAGGNGSDGQIIIWEYS